MSGEPSDEEIEQLRQKKMEQMREQAQGQDGGNEQQEAARQQADAQRKAMLRKHLTDGARKRLNAVEMTKPQQAKKAEQQVLALAQSGRVQGKIDEDDMRKILQELSPDSKDFNIERR
ncbi:DNA-binding protein [Halococcoides cellulosivorans]|uniref:DNA-binding protein HARCEL1_11495 n=1 Tax=Halococcoides cellulosivorans TaxID=1679096 RepID=A0A2R4X3K2_9EURY|nr:DNA-binding protein [Halococcoides cellulosivorans]AWB28283.1 DNA-binding protein [Halococcoides cellulosivorans]